jgi:hypothetical protein
MSTLRNLTLISILGFSIQLNTAQAQTFSQDFEGITAFSTLSAQGWTSGAFSALVTGADALAGGTSIRSGAVNNSASPANLTTPVLAISAATSINFKARLNSTSSNPILVVRITTATTPATTLADAITITTGGGSNQLGTVTRTFSVPVPASLTYPADYRVQFWVRGNGGSSRLTLDDVQVIPAVLPVDLVAFSGQPDAEGNVLLRWRTARERQNRGFEIERSADLRTWTYLGQRAGLGTSAVGGVYDFKDTQPLRVGYYRLRQVDDDGVGTYSKVIAVERPLRPGAVQLRPDAQGRGLHLDLDASEVSFPLTVSLFTATGQAVQQRVVEQPTDHLLIEQPPSGQPLLLIQLVDAAQKPFFAQRVILTN